MALDANVASFDTSQSKLAANLFGSGTTRQLFVRSKMGALFPNSHLVGMTTGTRIRRHNFRRVTLNALPVGAGNLNQRNGNRQECNTSLHLLFSHSRPRSMIKSYRSSQSSSSSNSSINSSTDGGNFGIDIWTRKKRIRYDKHTAGRLNSGPNQNCDDCVYSNVKPSFACSTT